MAKHLQKELGKLKKRLFSLSALVEEDVRDAIKAIHTLDNDLAQKVIQKDQVINNEEIEVEEECLKILALYQPVATDLRFIVSALKVNNELERIGDLAVNIAKRTSILSKHNVKEKYDFSDMAQGVQEMLKKALDSLINIEANTARQVISDDDKIDEYNRLNYDRIKKDIQNAPDQITPLIQYYTVSRILERMADHITNIAEDVIYMIEGQIVRHHRFEPAEEE